MPGGAVGGQRARRLGEIERHDVADAEVEPAGDVFGQRIASCLRVLDHLWDVIDPDDGGTQRRVPG